MEQIWSKLPTFVEDLAALGNLEINFHCTRLQNLCTIIIKPYNTDIYDYTISKEVLDNIIAERSEITEDVAQGLEMDLVVSAAMWLNLQKAYNQAANVK